MAACCPSCAQERDSFVCRTCLTKLLKLYKSQTSSHNSLLPAAQARALNGIKLAEANRQREAKHWQLQKQADTIKERVQAIKKDNDNVATQIEQRRQRLAERRARLASARSVLGEASSIEESPIRSPPTGLPLPALYQVLQEQQSLQERLANTIAELAETRQILLREVLEALNVKECAILGYRYQIASLPVSPLPELQDLPKQQLNATVSILILLIKLVASYLGLQLPFVLHGSPIKPLVRALPGTAAAAKYNKAYPLYMSSGSGGQNMAASQTIQQSGQAAQPSQTGTSTFLGTSTSGSSKVATAASHAQAFSIGLRMLAYNAYYIYQTSVVSTSAQDIREAANVKDASDPVDISDMLLMLVRACESHNIGRKSHILTSTSDTLRDVEHLVNKGDFASFLQAIEQKKGTNITDVTAVVHKEKKKGKYVVVSHDLTAVHVQGDVAGISGKEVNVGKDEDGWDIV